MGLRIRNIDYLKIKAPSGKTYAQELADAANELRQCIYARMNPGHLKDTLSAVKLTDVKVDKDGLRVEIDIQKARRKSVFYNKTHRMANVFWLLNDGFKVRKPVWFKNIPNFGYRTAAKFVEMGIQDFNAKNTLGASVEIKRPTLYFGVNF